MTASPAIAFIDLKAQRQRLGDRIDRAVLKVINSGAFIMGPEIAELERQLAEYCGVRHALSCGSGTDALVLLLMAKGVGPGDAVLCPAFTFAATAEAVALVGATPVFVDVCADDFNMDPVSMIAALAAARAAGLTVKGVMPVDLFGQPADYDAIMPIARAEGLWVLADAAQSFGAKLGNRRVGALGDFAATSFFPAKPLGCYGDGGAVFFNDDELREVLTSLRVHGQGTDKYDNVRIGLNARMDTVQAAILIEKLAIFDDEVEARDRVARRYNEGLADCVRVPNVREGRTSVWAQYTIRSPRRDRIAEQLKAAGIPTAIYYPKPLHRQAPYAAGTLLTGGLPVTDLAADQVLSLPMHPYLAEDVQDRIIDAVRQAAR